MAGRGWRLDVCLLILLMMVCSAIVVLELGLKAYCVGEMMLCFVMCFIIWLLMMVSKTLAMIGSKETGR